MTRPAVDYVSPLPPVRSGIADYSVDLLEELAPLCDLRLVHLPDQEVASELQRRYEVVQPQAVDPARRLPFYQLGNNVYHEGVRRLALEAPGVATVHDLRLHHLLVEATLASGDLDAYVAALGEEHGWEGAAAALPTRWGAHGRARLFEMPAHGSLLLRQRGLLVHSDWGRRFLAEELAERAAGHPGLVASSVTTGSLPEIRQAPMPMPAPDPPNRQDAADWRRRLGIPPAAVLLGSFGFQTPIKRTDVLLRALAAPGMEDVVAVVAGEASPGLDLETLIRDLGVQDRVVVTGFLDEATFPVALSACDLCINLRYPSAGETSASLLRTLALGRPAVVSDYAQFRELPDDVVVKAPLGDDPTEEAEALAGLLRRLLASPGRLRRMGESARAFIEREHCPSASARAVAAALAEWSTGLTATQKLTWAQSGPPAEAPAVPARSREPGRTALPADADRRADPPHPPPANPDPSKEIIYRGDTFSARVSPPTSLTWGWLPGRIEVEGCERPWAEGERRGLEIVVTNTGLATWLAGRHADGRVVLEPRLWSGDRDLLQGRPWIPLPRDLEPGETCRIAWNLRRPIGPARLQLEPHLFGGGAMTRCGAQAFDREL